MLSANAVIQDSLAPAVAISALGLLVLSLNNRITTVGSRVRDLTRELRSLQSDGDADHTERIENIQRQIPLFIRRGYLIQNALFLLFGSLGMMVLTAFALAMHRMRYMSWDGLPMLFFLSGLLLMLFAVLLEVLESVLNMRTLKLDVDYSLTPIR